MRDLTTKESSESLRRIAAVVGRGGRACAWALSTFEDEHRAAVALVTTAHVERARAALARVEASSNANHYAQHWVTEIARIELLLAEKDAAAPLPPRALSTFALERVGLERDADPRVPVVRKMGVRPAHVLIARHAGGRANEALADAAAIAADLFPIGEAWTPTARDVVVTETGKAISTDLAYGTRCQPRETAEGRIRRFLSLFDDDAALFLNGTRSEIARWYAPLTLATFDFGMAVVDRRRVGIVARTGED